MTGAVLAALRNAVKPARGTMFENFCALHNCPAFPALPAVVARFVADCQELGIEKLWPAICEISQAHVAAGLADPTVGGMAACAINAISKIDPPRSWPKEEKRRFYALPYDLQAYYLFHEAQNQKAIHRALNEAAEARKALAAIQQPKEIIHHGNQSHAAA